LTLRVDITDVAARRPVVRQMLNFRGDTDQAWQPATLYLLRELEELLQEAR
jgi:hypothetical protein